MTQHESSGVGAVQRQEYFLTTHWSVVLAAQQSDSARAHAALTQLCEKYWYPLYAFVRRQGYRHENAQDLTQEFFARLLAKRFVDDAMPERGRFRSFLLVALKHFLANEWDRTQAKKRGGGQQVISLNDEAAQARYALEPADNLSPEKLFDRRWATTLLEQVLVRLKRDYAAAGKVDLYEQLKDCLTFEASTPCAALATRLNTSEGAIKVAVHRLRARYRELLRDEIAQTVSTAPQLDEEIRELFAALAS